MPAVLSLVCHTNAQAQLKQKKLRVPVTERGFEAPSCSCSLPPQGCQCARGFVCKAKTGKTDIP